MSSSTLQKFGWTCLVVAVACLTAAPQGSAEESPMGSAYDPATGVTTSVTKNADGTREVVKTDADGKEISRETTGNEPVSKPKPNTDPVGGSITDPNTGLTTEIILNADGSKTKIVKDQDGNVLSNQKLEKEPVSKPKPNTDPIGGSAINTNNGIKTEVILNGNGTRTIIISKDGVELHRETIDMGKPMSEESYELQSVSARPVYIAPEPVFVERREVFVERAPSFSIGLGFAFGSGHKHSHGHNHGHLLGHSYKHHCAPCPPCPSKKKCK